MKRGLWILVMLACVQGVALAQAGEATITGQILTEAGVPVAGLMVAAEAVTDSVSNVAGLGETDSAGRYRLEGIPPGKYRIAVGKADQRTYYPNVRNAVEATILTVVGSVPLDDIDFVVPKRPVGFKVSGRIPRDPNPLARELVSLSPGARQVAAETNGTFEFSDVPPGLYEVGAQRSSALRSLTRTVVVVDNDVSGIELPLLPLVYGVGRVVQTEGLPPSFYLHLRNGEGSLTTGPIQPNTNGYFSVVLPPGNYTFSASSLPEGFRIDSIRYGAADALAGPVRIVRPLQELTISISPPVGSRRIRGRVTEMANANSAPLQAFLTTAREGRAIARSPVDADGRFEFLHIPEGVYAARVSTENSTTKTVIVSSKDIDDVELRIYRMAMVKGRVLVADGAPRPGITLGFDRDSADSPLRVTPNLRSDGTFMLTMPEGEYRLDPSTLEPSIFVLLAPGSLPFGYDLESIRYGITDLLTEPLKLDASDPRELTVTLRVTPPIFKVSGRIIGIENLNGQGSAGVTLSSTQFNLNLASTLDSDGRFEFPKVPPGTYTLRITPAAPGTSMSITVLDRDIAGVETRIPRLVQLKGKFLIEDGISFPPFSPGISPIGSIETSPIGMSIVGLPGGAFTALLPEGEFRVELHPARRVFRFDNSEVPPPGYTYRVMYGTTDVLSDTLKIDAADPKDFVVKIGTSTPFGKVRGRVVGVERLASSDLARVTLVAAQFGFSQETTIDANGTFEFPKVPPGVYFVRLPFSVRDATKALVTVAGSDVNDVELTVPRKVTLTGKMEIGGNSPAPTWNLTLLPRDINEPVSLFDMSGLRPRHDYVDFQIDAYPSVRADGTFTVTVPEGEYRVETRMSGSSSAHTLRSLTYGSTDLLEGTFKIDGSDLKLMTIAFDVKGPVAAEGPPVKVRGRVEGMETWLAQPWVSASALYVQLTGEGVSLSAPVNSDGTFEFAKVSRGAYTAYTSSGIPGATSAKVTVADQDAADVTLRIPRQVTVTARAVIEGGAPAPATLKFRFTSASPQQSPAPMEVTATFNADKIATFIMPEGEYRFDLNSIKADSSYLPREFYLYPPRDYYAYQSITHGTTNVLTQTLKIDAANSAEMIVTLRVDGPLVNARGRVESVVPFKQLGGSSVSLIGEGVTLYSPVAEDGTFEFQKVPSGSYMLSTSPYVQGTSSATVTIGGGDVTGLKVIVTPQVSMKARLVVEDDIPAPSRLTFWITRLPSTISDQAQSIHVSLEMNRIQGLPLTEGRYRIIDQDRLRAAGFLPSGYTLSLSYGTTDLLTSEFSIDATHPQELTASLRYNGPLLTVRGHVRGGSSNRVTFLSPQSAMTFSSTVFEDGTFTYMKTPPGIYRLLVMGNSGGSVETTITVTDRDVSDIELRLPAETQK